MICGNCRKEIGYDQNTVRFHLDGICKDIDLDKLQTDFNAGAIAIADAIIKMLRERRGIK